MDKRSFLLSDLYEFAAQRVTLSEEEKFHIIYTNILFNIIERYVLKRRISWKVTAHFDDFIK